MPAGPAGPPAADASLPAPAGPLQHTYRLQGVDVVFPFDAYACQKVYMERVIACLQGVRPRQREREVLNAKRRVRRRRRRRR